MSKSLKLKEKLDTRILVSIHTKDDVFRFKMQPPEQPQKYLEDIFSKEFFLHICPENSVMGIIRTALINIVILGDEVYS